MRCLRSFQYQLLPDCWPLLLETVKAKVELLLDIQLLVKCLALWGERERRGRHYSDQYTVQHSVQQPGRTLVFYIHRTSVIFGPAEASALRANVSRLIECSEVTYGTHIDMRLGQRATIRCILLVFTLHLVGTSKSLGRA